jgi:hypothetical protein
VLRAIRRRSEVGYLAGVHVRNRLAAKGDSLTNVSLCEVSQQRFAAIGFPFEDGQEFDGRVLISTDYLRFIFKWWWHRLRLS